ncbi:unnamed protein product [Ambrosiozyma monospora]|uniref:Unnamed protein product n=1 Tax=Ambrosiozyma monospora TaxID=43982 RepID=A0ACB5TBX3_AMBMO|nr:unnamed protein product [Ambrosiozyma monospora]
MQSSTILEMPPIFQSSTHYVTHRDDKTDKFIVLAFSEETLVLGITSDIEQVENSGFVTESTTTKGVAQIGQHSLVQIHSNGIRQIFYNENDEPQKQVDWSAPPSIEVLHSSCTNTQIALALSNRELVYFEVDEFDRLIEYSERKEMGAQISSLSLGDVSTGQIRFPFIIVGCEDQTLTVLKTDPDSTLEVVTNEKLSSIPSSLLAMYNFSSNGHGEEDGDDEGLLSGPPTLYLHAGLQSGVYARLSMDSTTGELSNPRNRYTGPKAVTLCKLKLAGQNFVGINSTRTYVGYPTDDLKIIALSKKICTDMCSLKSDDIQKNGVLGVFDNYLTIFTIDQLDTDLLIENADLRYTPRAMADCTELNGIIYVVESDYNMKSPYLEDVQNEQQEELETFEADEDLQELEAYYKLFGYESDNNSWGSCIQFT